MNKSLAQGDDGARKTSESSSSRRNSPRPKIQATREQKLRRGIALGLATTLSAILLLWAGVSLVQHWRLSSPVSSAQSSRALDTYVGHVDALELLEPAVERTRILPQFLDRAIFEGLWAMPGTSVSDLRAGIREEVVELSAFIEWRFESAGTRAARSHLDVLDEDLPVARTSRVYLTLLEGDAWAAFELAKESRERFPDDRALQEALAEAALAADALEDVPGLSDLLRAGSEGSLQRMLLATRLEDGEKSQARGQGFDTLLREHPGHVEATIVRAEALLDDEVRREELMTGLAEIARQPVAELGPFQTGRILHTMGNLSLADDNYEEAIGHFQKAIEASPKRDTLYPALVDLFVEQARYSEASEALEKMAEQVVDPNRPDIVQRKAWILLLRGRAEEAAQVLGTITMATRETHWVRG